MSGWLAEIGREFRQYGFNLIQAGVDRKFLPHLTDTHLKTDCQVGSNNMKKYKLGNTNKVFFNRSNYEG